MKSPSARPSTANAFQPAGGRNSLGLASQRPLWARGVDKQALEQPAHPGPCSDHHQAL